MIPLLLYYCKKSYFFAILVKHLLCLKRNNDIRTAPSDYSIIYVTVIEHFISIRAFENRLDMLRFLSFKIEAFC